MIKYDGLLQMTTSGQELSLLIESGKKNISTHALSPDKHQEHCQKRMVFVLDTIAQLGLKLNVYGSCKEKDKKWYITRVYKKKFTDKNQVGPHHIVI